VKIKGYEFLRSSGLPLSGLTVEVWDAVDGTPAGSPIDSTTTDGNGMWEFVGLTNSPKDVKVTNSGLVHWYKGATRHSLGRLLLSEGLYAPGVVNNQLVNPGLEWWQGGTGPFTTLNRFTADGWILAKGGASSISVSRDTANADHSSTYDASLVATIVDNAVGIFQKIENTPQYKGRTVSAGFRVKCSTANAVYAFISDNAGVTNTQSPKHSGSGDYEDLIVEGFAISGSLGIGNLWVGVLFALGATAFVANAVLNFGSLAMPYEPFDLSEDLARIGRYRQTIGGAVYYPYIAGVSTLIGQKAYANIPFRQRMGGVPTVTQSGTWSKSPGSIADPVLVGANQDGFSLSITSDATGAFEATPNTAVFLAEYVP
jgi:hypothetical protein